MHRTVTLPYGAHPYVVQLPDDAIVVEAPVAPEPPPPEALVERALDAPIGAAMLESTAPGARVLVVVSDHTRADPRALFLRAVLARLPSDVRLTLAIATGTHGPCDPGRLDLDAALWARAERVVNHDAFDDAALVDLGVTARGTPVRVHRCVLETDLVVATGTIKPHYFAGYGAGVKSIFPGLGGNREIRINHRLKREPGAVAGSVDDNPCRRDLEEAVGLVPAPTFLLNLVADAAGRAQAAVAGHVVTAFRRGAELCRALHAVRAPSSGLVIVSDALPVTGSLYQASKLVAACAPLVEDGGVVALVAQCPDGTGPIETVNRAIYELGLAPRLPAAHRIVLISDLPEEAVSQTYCEWAPSVQEVVARSGARPVVLPHAGTLIVERL